MAFGHGYRYRFGRQERFSLAVYPDTKVARLTSPLTRHEFFRQEPPHITEEGMIFATLADASAARIVITPENGVALVIAAFPGDEALQASPTPVSASDDSQLAEDQERPRSDDSVTSQEYPESELATPEKRRVHLAGVVGRTPT